MVPPFEGLTFGQNTPASQSRLAELVLYIAQETAQIPDFGSTKINKTLYYADLEAFKTFGKALTGAQYQRIRMGPAPKHIRYVEGRLEKAGHLRIDRTEMTHKRVALREPDLSGFDPQEMALVDKYIDDLKDQTSTAVSEDSHDVRWKVVQDNELIPYDFAFLGTETSDKDRQASKELAEEFGW